MSEINHGFPAPVKTFPFLPQAVNRWCATNPAITSQRVDGGHCFMQEDPDESARQIHVFLLERLSSD